MSREEGGVERQSDRSRSNESKPGRRGDVPGPDRRSRRRRLGHRRSRRRWVRLVPRRHPASSRICTGRLLRGSAGAPAPAVGPPEPGPGIGHARTGRLARAGSGIPTPGRPARAAYQSSRACPGEWLPITSVRPGKAPAAPPRSSAGRAPAWQATILAVDVTAPPARATSVGSYRRHRAGTCSRSVARGLTLGLAHRGAPSLTPAADRVETGLTVPFL
jgi:hypothetical protein